MTDHKGLAPYKPWEFCKSIDCSAPFRIGLADCRDCKAYQIHQYLREHGQILEEGSMLLAELHRLDRYEQPGPKCNKGHENTLPIALWDCPVCREEVRAQLAEAQADNAALVGKLNAIQDYFSNPKKYDGAWTEWHSATIRQLMSKAHPGDSIRKELERLQNAIRATCRERCHMIHCTKSCPFYAARETSELSESLYQAKAGEPHEPSR